MRGDDFYEQAQAPDFSDKMTFQIKRTPEPYDGPEVTFSAEAVEEMFFNIQRFIFARIMGRQKTGEGPKEINVVVDIDWSSDPNVPADLVLNPWWDLDDQGAPMTVPDGDRRARAIGKKKPL